MRDTLQTGSLGADVRRLQTMLVICGSNLTVDGVFGALTRDEVCDFQSDHELTVDGIVGPLTWAVLETATRKATNAQTIRDPLAHAGRFAIELALHWWQRDVYDPKPDDLGEGAEDSKQSIGHFIRAGLGESWLDGPYEGDGDFEWCGAFAGKCWEKIKAHLRELYFASTYRLDRYGSYRSAFGEKNVGTGRLYAKLNETSRDLPFEPREGDILLVGLNGYGQHICLVETFDGRDFHTVEGNGTGFGPHGERQHGVIRRRHTLGARKLGMWCPRRLIRPAAEDLG